MATLTLIIVLVLATLHLGPVSSGLYTKRFRLRRASGANATVFNHVYNIRMPRCESCAADVAVPTATMQEVRGETTQQQLYEHTLEGEQQMVFTHRINIPPQACGCPSADTLQTLLSRLEALEAQVAAFKDQCPGGTCCAATQAGNGQTDIQGLCNGHGKFDLSKCSCECEKGWGGPTCSDSSCPDNCSDRGKCVDGECQCLDGFTGESCEQIACKDDCNDQGRCVKGKCVCFPGYTGSTCGTMACPENCRGHGRCVKDACVCDPGFTGPDCGSKACPENCRDRGKCINGTCVCNAGFVGTDCGTPSCPENCRNRGKCVDGKCICNAGYMGPDCGSRSCPENCKNRGQCINGKCICNPGFAGTACGARSCPDNCHDHGQCINGKCVCNPGYSGPSCSSKTCPDNCNRRGVCEDGKCVCSEGFTGPNCGTRTCPENCRDRGKCEDGKCICQAGFTGLSCETKTCPENCSNRGRCEDGRCICVDGYSGSNCKVKTCPDNCKNRGRCEDGQCVCAEGYTGHDCGTKTCPDNCNSHGQCVDGQCICQTGFTGPNCGIRACPNNCNNRGKCENGKCFCEEGYAGPICGLKVCPKNCNNRGRCQKGTCICRRGYTGPDCGETTCPGQCQGHGLCVDGICQCQVGFSGPDCSERTCPNACSERGKCIDGKCVCQEGFSGEDCSTEVPTVQGFRVKTRQETWVIMEWERLQTSVDGFEISFRPKKEENGGLSSRLRSTITAFNQTGLAPGEEYLVTIRTQKDQTLGSETTQTVTTRIDGPKNLRATEKTQSTITLRWDKPAARIDRYLVSYISSSGVPRQVAVPTSAKEMVTLTDLDSGVEYTVAVIAEKGSESSVPATTTATTAAVAGKATIPPRLGDLTISNVTRDSLRLSWTVLDGDFESFLILYKDTEGRTQELPVPGNLRIATISGLKPSKKYKFLLHGISGAKRSKPVTAEVTTAAPSKEPLDRLPKLGELSVSNVQKDTLTLSWTVTNGDFDSFLILYKDSEGVSQELAVDGDLHTTTIKGLKPSKKYKFALYGVSDDRRGQPSSAEAITASTEDPSTPSPRMGNLTVSEVTKDSLRLSWTLHSGGYDTFLIIYKNAEGSPRGVPLQGNQRTALVTGLAPSTNYTFLLFGVTGRNRSVPITASATTESDQAVQPLPGLEDLFVSNITKDSLQLSWAVGAGDFDSFLIQYRNPGGKTQELLVDGDQHTAKISGLVPSEKYTFYLQGNTATYRVGPISTEAVTASSEKPITQQGRLGDISVSNVTRNSLRLSWTISVGDFDSFIVQYRDAEGRVQELPVTGDLRSTTISGLRPSKKYKFILYGVSGNKRSKSISTEATTAPLEKVPTRPPQLGDLSVSDITKDSLQLSWDVEDGAFGSFLIQYKDAEGVLRELTMDGDFRTARIVGLKPARKYKFTLYGISGDKRSKAVSREAMTAEPEKAVSHSPRLGEFFVTDITKESIQLSWTVDDGDFDSFVIQYRDADGQTQELVVDGDIHTTAVAGLLPSRKYKFNLYGISRNKRTKPLSTDATTAFPEAVGQQAAMLDDLYLSDVGPYSAQLSWVASEGAFDSFLIQYVDSQAIAPPREMVVAGDVRTAPIGSLQPNTEYTFTLTGLQRGQKRADLNTMGRTSRLDLEPPRNLQFRNIQETSLMVSWTPPTTSVDTFKVSYQLADGGEPQSITVDGKSNKAPLKGLTPGNRYEVNVMSIRGFEESEPLTGYVTTVPDGPTDLRATNVTETSALLLWRPALASVDTYVVTYSAQNVPEITKTLSGNIAELQLNGLKIDTEYSAQIHSAKGSNRSSPATTTFTTSADAPRDLTASRISPRSAVLSWTPPKAMPTGYILTYEAPSGETKEIKFDASANSYKLIDLIPSSQYRARVQALRGRVRTAPTSTVFTTARLRYPFPKDCAEERLNGASHSHPVTVYLNGDNSRPVRVFCDMETDGGGWMVFQRRINGKTNFWRNWDDYAKGFGNLTQEFWLGNENLHKLTSQDTYELRVDLRTKNESAYAVYDSFRVDTQANYYRLRIGKYSGNAGDSLSYHNNMIFSTRDRDRNKHIMPCAISYRGAWWYKNCHYVNLNGLYGNNKDHQGVNWYSWKGFEFSIPFTEMKMRPKNNVALRRI